MLAGFPHGETLGEYRALSLEERTRRQDEAWAAGFTRRYPLSWQQRLIDRWAARHGDSASDANAKHRARCQQIDRALRAGLKPDDRDDDIDQRAMETAREMGRRIQVIDHAMPAEWPEGVRLLLMLAEVLDWCERSGVDRFARMHGRRLKTAPTIASVLARAKDDRTWRSILYRLHAQSVEATAREMGLVSATAGAYASDDAVKRRRGQRARHKRALESQELMNEAGQCFTMDALASKSTADKTIRRNELMTRLAGFERIARELGHVAYFLTVTCPSRMHAQRMLGRWRCEENPKFDGTTMPEAQAYLCKQWSRLRSWWDRRGFARYGFRIAEPQHDGTPHWHIVLFFPRSTDKGRRSNDVLMHGLRRYFLFNDSPDEAGAAKHRIKVERIDPNRGTAAGYAIKYIAKNIDGHGVGKDLLGHDAIVASERVEAWATHARIRQFQQIGGAPVTLWREARRLNPAQEGIAPPVALLLDAVNLAARNADAEGKGIAQQVDAADAWATYTHMQGGPVVKRAALRFELVKEQTGELGRFGDPMAPKVVGVQVVSMRREPLRLVGWVNKLVQTGPLPVVLQVESERSTWINVGTIKGDDETKEQARERLRSLLGRSEAAPPWSPVNNCTRRGDALSPMRVERHAKKGRWHRFERRAASQPTLQASEHDVDHSRARR